jgi:predicted porin
MKLHGTLQNQVADNSLLTSNTDTKAASIGLTYPMGANRLLAKYSTLKRDAGPTNAIGTTSKVVGIGLERDLSKNTYAYARYENAKYNHLTAENIIVNNAVAGASTDIVPTPTRRTIAVGLSMGF